MRVVFCLLLAVLLLLAPVASAQPLCPPDVVSASASGDTITVRHAGAERNCCTQLTLVVRTQDFVVDFLEGEADPWCHCICCFSLLYEASGFVPGHYRVRVWDGTGEVLYGEDEVDVLGGDGSIVVGMSERGDCTVSTMPRTWSEVRVLYR